MAHNALRLRRALSLSTFLCRLDSHRRLTPATCSVSSLLHTLHSSSPQIPTTAIVRLQIAGRCFHSTPLSLSSSRSFNDADEIGPDTILFEGCDYKHWLIVMDFPNDPKERPPAEEMVETYVQTLAKVVGSVEEAKKKMYACSTTIYTGFQAEVDEETAMKFEGMPGVIFVLPDSYIDPVNKEYGGDKYINGTIIPRPPPVQYGRARRGSRNNVQRPRGQIPNQQGNPAYCQQGNPAYNQQRNPVYNQQSNPAYNQHGNSAYNQHGNPAYNQPGSLPGDGRGQMPQQGYSQQQNFPPQQNYGSLGQGVNGNAMTRDSYQGHGSNYMPSHQVNYPAEERGSCQGGGSNYMHSHQENYNRGYNHPQGQMDSQLGDYRHYASQGQMGNRLADHKGYAPQGQMGLVGDNMNYSCPRPARGAYGQAGVGSSDQGAGEQYGPGPNGAYEQRAGSAYGPGYTPGGETQVAQTSDQPINSMSAEQRNYSPTGHNGMNQGRY